MKFLLDENVDFPLATYLRSLNFDVKTISETEPSIEDKLESNFVVVTDRKIRINEF